MVAGGVHGCSRGHVCLLPGGVHGCSGGVHAWLLWWGVCGCSRGACVVAPGGHAWLLRGHAWLLLGGMHGIQWDKEIQSMSGRYASYWNAFLLESVITIFACAKWHQIQMNRATRLHSSRMHTARLLSISPSMHCTGWCLGPGGCLVLGGAWSGGAVPGSLGGVVSQHALRQTPPPPCEQNDRFVCGW